MRLSTSNVSPPLPCLPKRPRSCQLGVKGSLPWVWRRAGNMPRTAASVSGRELGNCGGRFPVERKDIRNLQCAPARALIKERCLDSQGAGEYSHWTLRSSLYSAPHGKTAWAITIYPSLVVRISMNIVLPVVAGWSAPGESALRFSKGYC